MAVSFTSPEQFFSQQFEALPPDTDFYAPRHQAFQAFQQQGLPTQKNEAYKYTPISQLLTKHIHSWEKAEQEAPPKRSLNNFNEKYLRIEFHNGRVSAWPDELSTIQCLTFAEAYQQGHRAFLEHFAQQAQQYSDPFSALNGALFEEGTFIYIPTSTVLSKPLLLDHYTTGALHARPMTHPRLLIIAAPHSEATVISTWQGTGLVNALTEIVVEAHAHLSHYTLQTRLAPDAGHIQAVQSYQEANSTFNAYTFTWSGQFVRNNLHCAIAGPHAETNMYGLYALREKQHVDNFTTVDHQKPYSQSNELYKGIVTEEATGVFNGRIYVRPGAQKTNAFQANNNLVLSEQATLHTKPQLEIWTDDVKCSHGATTGQLDPEQLFYLQSRGISKEKAQKMLREAFVQEVIEKVAFDTLQVQLQAEWMVREGL